VIFLRKLYKGAIISIGIIATILFLFYPIATHYTLIINERIAISDQTGNTVSFYLNDKYIGTWHNNMTYVGDDAINARLFNSSWTGSFWNYIAIGTGDGASTNKSRTALVTEIDRQLATFYKPADAQWGLNYTFTFASSYTVKEAGILNAAASGTLAFYVWNLNIGVTSVDSLKISWQGTTNGY